MAGCSSICATTSRRSRFPIAGIFSAAIWNRMKHRSKRCVREVSEELGVRLEAWRFFRRYECHSGDAYPNIKHIYHAQIDRRATELTLAEGQRLAAIARAERSGFAFANILAAILEDFIAAGLWPVPVDNSFARVAGK